MTLALWRVAIDGTAQLARGDVETGPVELLAAGLRVADLLLGHGASIDDLARLPGSGAVPSGARVLAPVDDQPVWAAGVTFPRSRDARREEASDGGDVYDRVYRADRPELFFKAHPDQVVAAGDDVGIRADSAWNVPEPELAVVADASGTIRAVTLGNDMSSRSIEGENPLYLPQAKVYERSCALGPALVPTSALPDWTDESIELLIARDGDVLFRDVVHLATIRRTPAELIRWLFAANAFAAGVVLLTGTSMVPPADFTLRPGDCLTIRTPRLGALQNGVREVGALLGA